MGLPSVKRDLFSAGGSAALPSRLYVSTVFFTSSTSSAPTSTYCTVSNDLPTSGSLKRAARKQRHVWGMHDWRGRPTNGRPPAATPTGGVTASRRPAAMQGGLAHPTHPTRSEPRQRRDTDRGAYLSSHSQRNREHPCPPFSLCLLCGFSNRRLTVQSRLLCVGNLQKAAFYASVPMGRHLSGCGRKKKAKL